MKQTLLLFFSWIGAIQVSISAAISTLHLPALSTALPQSFLTVFIVHSEGVIEYSPLRMRIKQTARTWRRRLLQQLHTNLAECSLFVFWTQAGFLMTDFIHY